MARIKSALEIALERVDDIESDPRQLVIDQMTQRGKRLAGHYLYDIDASIDEVRSALSESDTEDGSYLKQAFIQTLLSNLKLPQDEMYVQLLGRIKDLMLLTGADEAELTDLFVQTDNLYNQYLQNREQLYDHLVKQYEPRLQQKKQQLAQRTGQSIDLRPEQDKEFLELLSSTQKRMDDQYNEVLGQLREAFGQAMGA